MRFTCPTLDVGTRLGVPHISAGAEDDSKRGRGVQDEGQRKKLDAALEERQLRKLAAAQAEDQERARQWRLVKGAPQPHPSHPHLPPPPTRMCPPPVCGCGGVESLRRVVVRSCCVHVSPLCQTWFASNDFVSHALVHQVVACYSPADGSLS